MLVTCKQYEPGVEKHFDEQCKVNPHQTPFPIFFLRPYIRDKRTLKKYALSPLKL